MLAAKVLQGGNPDALPCVSASGKEGEVIRDEGRKDGRAGLFNSHEPLGKAPCVDHGDGRELSVICVRGIGTHDVLL